MACGPMTAWRRHHAVKGEGRTLTSKQEGKILENSINMEVGIRCFLVGSTSR